MRKIVYKSLHGGIFFPRGEASAPPLAGGWRMGVMVVRRLGGSAAVVGGGLARAGLAVWGARGSREGWARAWRGPGGGLAGGPGNPPEIPPNFALWSRPP